MALVNPNIAMGYRAPDIQPQNMLADYAAIQQIQGGRQAQQLNALQMQEYQRARAEEEGVRNYLTGKDLAAPETRTGLMQFGKTGLGYVKNLNETQTAAATLAETKSKTTEREFKLAKDKLRHGWESMGDASTPQAAIEKLSDGVKNGYFDMKTAAAEIQKLQNMPPDQYKQYRVEKIMGLLDAKDQLGFMLPKVARQDIGNSIVNIQDNPMQPGYGLPVAGANITKTATIGERTAQGQLAVSQGQLQVAKDRLAQESQGVTYQQDDQGNIVALPSKLSAGVTPVARAVTGEGGVPFKGKDSTKTAVSEQQAAYNIGRVLTAADQINKITKTDPSALKPGMGEAAAASMGMSGTANLARNANRQIVSGAQRDALDALLYLATGAAYNKEQLEGQMAAYIPSYTDAPETVAAKKTRMTDLIGSAKTRAGKAWTPQMESAMKSLTEPGASSTASGKVTPAADGKWKDL